MTNWNILLESATDGQTTATVLELPAFQVAAGDRQTAFDQIQQLLKQRLANAEVVPVSMPIGSDSSNPWLKFGGIFRSDADFEAIVRAIQRERQESVADNSDAFQELYDDLAARADTDYTDPEDRDEYMAENVFWVPKEARWSHIQASAKQPTIGKIIDEAMLAIEKENPKRLKGVLPTGYAHPDLDKTRLGELIDLISTIWGMRPAALRTFWGGCMSIFWASLPRRKARVAMIQPYKGRVYAN